MYEKQQFISSSRMPFFDISVILNVLENPLSTYF